MTDSSRNKSVTEQAEPNPTLIEEYIIRFFKLEAAGGILLMAAAVLALIFANTPLRIYYDLLLDTPVEVQVGALIIHKPLLLWINDGLMAIFFFLVGLELKRELLEGELSNKSNIILPGIGALGGMLVPALIYVFFNHEDERAMQGWAIPAATDIAFALGVLSLLGSRVPNSIKVFLTSLAIFDDIGAIIIIAIFYTANISFVALLVVAACIPILFYLNRRNIEAKSVYLTVGAIMWVALLKSGVHATLSGILVAFFIPMQSRHGDGSPLRALESDLHDIVAYFVLPIFAFANAGLAFRGMGLEHVLHHVSIGVALGLFVGKQIGVFALCALAILFKLARMPDGMSWKSLYGTAALCGIGFTMSLFIGSLAFEETNVSTVFDERLGILLGSLASGVLGYVLLHFSLKKEKG